LEKERLLLFAPHGAESASLCPNAATMAYVETCDATAELQRLKWDPVDKKIHNMVLTTMCASDCGTQCFATKLVGCDATDVGIYKNGCSNPAVLGGWAGPHASCNAGTANEKIVFWISGETGTKNQCFDLNNQWCVGQWDCSGALSWNQRFVLDPANNRILADTGGGLTCGPGTGYDCNCLALPLPPTPSPTPIPTTAGPSSSPTPPTTAPTFAPTNVPTVAPTNVPTSTPTTAVPTNVPTVAPTHAPTSVPTFAPTYAPTHAPTEAPTPSPTTADPPSIGTPPQSSSGEEDTGNNLGFIIGGVVMGAVIVGLVILTVRQRAHRQPTVQHGIPPVNNPAFNESEPEHAAMNYAEIGPVMPPQAPQYDTVGFAHADYATLGLHAAYDSVDTEA
jgi:hypothetical protein